MRIVKCQSQAELDAALADATASEIWVVGAGMFFVSDAAQVTAYDAAQVTAGKWVAVTRHGTIARVDGGVVIQVPAIRTAIDWCDYYGVTVDAGIATLYKGVNAAYVSPHGMSYAPGTLPAATDWHPRNACGYGLHFSPRPAMTRTYNPEAQKYVACGVRLDELVVTGDEGRTPDKVKAPRVVTPCIEVTIDGDLVMPEKVVGQAPATGVAGA